MQQQQQQLRFAEAAKRTQLGGFFYLRRDLFSLYRARSFFQDERRSRVTTPYGRLTSGEKRQCKVSNVLVNPLRGCVMSVAGRRPSSSSSSSRQQRHRGRQQQQQQQQQQLFQLQLAGPMVDAPYDAVLLENEDIAL